MISLTKFSSLRILSYICYIPTNGSESPIVATLATLNNARLALTHVGDVELTPIAAHSRRCSSASWADMERLIAIDAPAYMLIVRCPAATWSHDAMQIEGQHVGG